MSRYFKDDNFHISKSTQLKQCKQCCTEKRTQRFNENKFLIKYHPFLIMVYLSVYAERVNFKRYVKSNFLIISWK
jgi:hypothetical protein